MLVRKLQRVQNFEAKAVKKKKKSESVTESLKQLHWLPIECRFNLNCW